MILQFMRRDRAWQWTPYVTAAAALAAFLSGAYGTWLPVLMGPVYILLWMRAMPHERATFFEAALPVSARDLFMARFLSLLSMIWLPAVGASIALVLTRNGIATLFEIALVLTMCVTINLSVRIQEFAAPQALTLVCVSISAGSAALAVIVGHPMLVAGICATVSAAIFGIAWRAIPETFQSAPLEPAAARLRFRISAPSSPWWAVVRCLFPWQTAVFIPITLLWLTSGQWIWAPLYLIMSYGQIRQNTRWIQALPMRRTAMTAAMTLPLLLVLACGAEFGMLTGRAARGRELVRATGTVDVYVSPAFWQLAPGGKVPDIQAPWGEAVQPPPFRALGMAFYNPYAVGGRNTQRFDEWQFARATTTIYGRPFSPRELAQAENSRLKPVTLQPRMQILTIGAILAMALSWVWLIELFYWHRLTRLSSTSRNLLTFAVWGLTLGSLMVDLFFGKIPGLLSQQILEGALLFASRHLPGNLAAVALFSLAPVAIIFWIADRQSAVSEIPRQVQQKLW